MYLLTAQPGGIFNIKSYLNSIMAQHSLSVLNLVTLASRIHSYTINSYVKKSNSKYTHNLNNIFVYINRSMNCEECRNIFGFVYYIIATYIYMCN